jgi:hypothetical protein
MLSGMSALYPSTFRPWAPKEFDPDILTLKLMSAGFMNLAYYDSGDKTTYGLAPELLIKSPLVVI